MNTYDTMQTGKVVRAIDHGSNVQVLCTDERGLLSAYFEVKCFSLFHRLLKKAGLKLEGLQIAFNRVLVYVPALGKTYTIGSAPRKSWRAIFTR